MHITLETTYADILNTLPLFLEIKNRGFSKDVCRSMVSMLDVDKSGKLGFEEFKTLWVDIRNWKVSDKIKTFKKLLCNYCFVLSMPSNYMTKTIR